MLAPAASAAEHDALLWTGISANGPIGRHILLTADAQARFGSAPADSRQFLIRAGLGTELAPGTAVHAGYALFRSGNTGDLATEHRFWQQIGLPLAGTERLSLSARTRLEQRFLSNDPTVRWRLRQQLRAELPLGRPNGTKAVLATEGLFNLNRRPGAARTAIDQWRFQLGLSVPIAKGISIEPSYLNIYTPRRGLDLDAHILRTMLMWRW
jgi:hypothetical protein